MRRRLTIFGISAALVLMTILLYLPVTGHQFVVIDDHEYITENPMVQAGITLSGIVWAFSTGHASNWHPMTWLSHMVDCQIYGLAPGGHHLTNVLLHAANVLLLFLLLLRMTSRTWCSACVAAFFAVHPLHVESVAWASERKDVLSACFFLLTLWFYFNHTRQPQNRRPYILALILFALGLMSKPMLVTLPCVLLLLDYWPLKRFGVVPLRQLLVEKLPFFALALADGIVTCLVQRGATSSFELAPFFTRIANAVVAYALYIGDTFWPLRLAVMYPYSRTIPAWSIIGGALLLAILTALFLLRARREPFLIVGWLWFLGTLVPTIGLIQVGAQCMADRYMYIPSIGLFIVVVWGAAAWLSGVAPARMFLGGVALAALAACVMLTRVQLKTWADSGELLRHAIKVTRDNYIAWDGLGTYLDSTGQRDEAIKAYTEALRLKPNYAQAQYDLGTALLAAGRRDEAMQHLLDAVKYDPAFARAHINLGKAFLDQGRVADAAEHMAKAVRLTPRDPEAQYNLGTVLLMQSKPDEAFVYFSEAIRLRPRYAEAHSNLGIILMGKGQLSDGIAHFAEASRLDANNPEAHFNFGLSLLQANEPAEAAEQFTVALKLRPESAKTHYHLAVALSQQKHTAKSLEHARAALDLARAAGQTPIADQAQKLIDSLSAPPP